MYKATAEDRGRKGTLSKVARTFLSLETRLSQPLQACGGVGWLYCMPLAIVLLGIGYGVNRPTTWSGDTYALYWNNEDDRISLSSTAGYLTTNKHMHGRWLGDCKALSRTPSVVLQLEVTIWVLFHLHCVVWFLDAGLQTDETICTPQPVKDACVCSTLHIQGNSVHKHHNRCPVHNNTEEHNCTRRNTVVGRGRWNSYNIIFLYIACMSDPAVNIR